MFHVVSHANRDKFSRQLEAMHAHRPEMFDGRPGGGPEAAAGRLGKDRFDDRHAHYVMSVDSWGEIECCVRLRPANQGSIIGSYYRHGIDSSEPPPETEGTWEMSHYYARGGGRGSGAGSRLRAQMRLAVLAAAAQAGVSRIISVAELAFWPAAERCGWSARRIGPAFAYCDGAEAVVYQIDSTPADVEAFRDWLENDQRSRPKPDEASDVEAVADRLGKDGLGIMSSLTRRIAEVEENDGADAAMALAEKLNRAADQDSNES